MGFKRYRNLTITALFRRPRWNMNPAILQIYHKGELLQRVKSNYQIRGNKSNQTLFVTCFLNNRCRLTVKCFPTMQRETHNNNNSNNNNNINNNRKMSRQINNWWKPGGVVFLFTFIWASGYTQLFPHILWCLELQSYGEMCKWWNMLQYNLVENAFTMLVRPFHIVKTYNHVEETMFGF